jgi:hypothetical protein
MYHVIGFQFYPDMDFFCPISCILAEIILLMRHSSSHYILSSGMVYVLYWCLSVNFCTLHSHLLFFFTSEKNMTRIIRRWLLNWSTSSALEGFLFSDYGSSVR